MSPAWKTHALLSFVHLLIGGLIYMDGNEPAGIFLIAIAAIAYSRVWS